MGMPLPPARPLSPSQLRLRSRIARVGMIAAWVVIAMSVYANFDQSLIDNGLGVFYLVANLFFAVSFVLWIMMWLEFFRAPPAKHRLVWVFLLLPGPIPGALLFYYKVWKVRLKALPIKTMEPTG
jgi:hypothetical protein